VAAPPSAESQGVIDLAVTKDEKFLYVQNATSGTVDGFRIGRNGSLTKVGTTTGLPPSPSPAWRASPRCKEAATAAPAPRTVPVRGAMACPYGTGRSNREHRPPPMAGTPEADRFLPDALSCVRWLWGFLWGRGAVVRKGPGPARRCQW
jgi:hypothetical protein